jgi:hypothetical protein
MVGFHVLQGVEEVNPRNHVGDISGQFSLKDTYDIVIDDASSVPGKPVISAAMVIDTTQES